MVKDPVCWMTVDERRAAAQSEYQGQVYYFCTLTCKRAFDRDPEYYARSGFARFSGATAHSAD